VPHADGEFKEASELTEVSNQAIASEWKFSTKVNAKKVQHQQSTRRPNYRKYKSFLISSLDASKSTSKGVLVILEATTSTVFHFAVKSSLICSDVVACLPIISTINKFSKETLLFSIDRFKQLGNRFALDFMQDVPNIFHLQAIERDSNWGDLLNRVMSTLTWADRQLLMEIGNLDVESRACYQLLRECQSRTNPQTLLEADVETHGANNSQSIEFQDISTSSATLQANGLDGIEVQDVIAKQQELIEDAERGDEEAQYELARVYCKPVFDKMRHCYKCLVPFGISCFRHHCRHCGRSYCHTHSSESRPIPRLGYASPVRVCEACVFLIDSEVLWERVLWRVMRAHSYLSGSLIPYFEHPVDAKVDQAAR